MKPAHSLVFALDRASGRLRHVRQVPNGDACDCICPGCESPLRAVNAVRNDFVQKPHFRHQGREPVQCAVKSALLALQSAISPGTRVDLPPTLQPRSLFDAPPDTESPAIVKAFVIHDHASALLELEDGRTFSVLVHAHDSRPVREDGRFDLVVDCGESALLDIDSIDALRHKLTVDRTLWRWCARQTSPDPLGAPVTEANSQGERAQPPGLPPSLSAIPQVSHEWTDTYTFTDGRVLKLHRVRWLPSGVMTETPEMIEPVRGSSSGPLGQ